MPPKARITKEMILDAAIEVIRENGHENLNVRTIAQRLGCSTQPVLYSFKTVDEIREAAYQAADEYHTEYIMSLDDAGDSAGADVDAGAETGADTGTGADTDADARLGSDAPAQTGAPEDALLALGLNYVRFGHEEKNLFRFLFQTNKFGGMDVEGLLSDPNLSDVVGVIAEGLGCDEAAAHEVFLTFFAIAHGLASLLANNAMDYDEVQVANMLGTVFEGICALQAGEGNA